MSWLEATTHKDLPLSYGLFGPDVRSEKVFRSAANNYEIALASFD